MKKSVITTVLLLAGCLFATSGYCSTKKGEKIDGKNLFEEHCAACHPNGGNIVNAKKPLSRKSLRTNGVKSEKDIIAKMRKPGPGMTAFDENTVPNAEAKAIAKYVMMTFK